jgi:heme/copper-type cytochrome/quinol oxidase subunit 2
MAVWTRSSTSTVDRGATAREAFRIPYALWFPLLVYVLTRVIDAVFIVVAGHHQAPMTGLDPNYLLSFPSARDPGYGVVATNWDGQWYRLIAENGYPAHLPTDAQGHVLMNGWAFFPLFPLSAGLLSRLTGLGFTTVAPVLNVILGAIAILVMYRLLRGPLSRFAASATVVVTCVFMSAPALQLSYTEGPALLLVCLSLLLLRSRRYAWFAVAALALSMTRPIALVLVPVVVAHWLARRRDPDDDFSRNERRRVALLVPWCGVVTGLWPLIAAVVTGDLLAYPKTMAAWKVYKQNLPLGSWVGREVRDHGLVLGLLLCVALPALLVFVVRRPAARAWGTEVRTWAWAYPVYLFTVTAPGPSIVRYLLLAFPLMWPRPDPDLPPATAKLHRMVVLPALVVAGLALQWYWIYNFVVIQTQPHRGPFP